MTRLCDICGSRFARYVCQECGRPTCEFCFIPERWLCIKCYEKLAYPTSASLPQGENGINLPFKLFLAGFIITFLGAIILAFSSLYATLTQGSFIWIFPFFIFGAKQAQNGIFVTAIIFALIFLATSLFIIYKTIKTG